MKDLGKWFETWEYDKGKIDGKAEAEIKGKLITFKTMLTIGYTKEQVLPLLKQVASSPEEYETLLMEIEKA